MTSMTEGLGTSILDAMSCEIPVVATNCGGIPEIVIPDKTGRLEEVANVNSLQSAVQSVFEQPSKTHEMIKNAKKMVDEEFSAKTTAMKTLDIYKSVLSHV
jgi:colanic acid/amylovoran biosynthesis glycosyltransferase